MAATLTIRDRCTVHRCNETAAAAVIAAALRAGWQPTVVDGDDAYRTRWEFTRRDRHVDVEAVNPHLLCPPTPPAWATRLTTTVARLI